MKRSFLYIPLCAFALSSCVSASQYESLDAKYMQSTKDIGHLRVELDALKSENAELLRQNQSLTTQITDLQSVRSSNEGDIAALQRRIEAMQQQYDTTMENYMQQLSGRDRDLVRANNLLTARTKELNEKEAAYQRKELALQQRQYELEQAQTAARQALESKERELESVRNAVTKALVGFADKGLQVETRDGKVYVSMASKLMFPSASWTVSEEGNKALVGIARVLEENPDLNIMVEGHTDNDIYKGSSAVRDNWDLSVMRATAIVKLLLQYGPRIDPARIEACGHGEYAPKVENNSAANKAVNRRTEIILTPKLDDLLKIVE
ncbi:MAG: chemotaxis protein MotB [bacterium P3]|nr:MAG: chemotaxis protein MotB [bacterium P201]KWW30459.1 MAG: chemotaxis protein MotB [bacterium P3]KWW41346.1 MAG: chemotaxis protein MotB [bacterium F083]